MRATCCWCGSPFLRLKGHYWCESLACRDRQASYAVGAKSRQAGDWHYLYVPLPKQVEYEECLARKLLAGGAAGTCKSHGLRWRLYRRALRIPNYEALLLRKTWPELEKHHLRIMEKDAVMFTEHGIPCQFNKGDRELRFNINGNLRIIEGGHMENPDDVEKYLSRERDDIACDEGSTFPPQPMLELSTRARSTKPEVLADGGARFSVYTNPGGPSSVMLRDLFIDHNPDFDLYPALNQVDDDGIPFYNAKEYAYIPGRLEDNPYLPPDYEKDLAVLQPWRYQQLRHNDWNIMSGLFFTSFRTGIHVKNLGNPSPDVGWFGSLDYGYINPGVYAWWVPLADGRLYRRFELKFQLMAIPVVCEKIKEINRRFGIKGVQWTMADPSLWSPDTVTGEDRAETFRKCGVPLRKGNHDRVNGWQRCREWLEVRPDNTPWMVVHPDCRYFIRCLANAVSSKANPEDVDTNCEDHPLDDWRYYVMSRPSPLVHIKQKVYPKHSAGALFEQAKREAAELR